MRSVLVSSVVIVTLALTISALPANRVKRSYGGYGGGYGRSYGDNYGGYGGGYGRSYGDSYGGYGNNYYPKIDVELHDHPVGPYGYGGYYGYPYYGGSGFDNDFLAAAVT